MSAPERIVIAGGWGECGSYYSNATEAEGEHGGIAVEYIRADLVEAAQAKLDAALEWIRRHGIHAEDCESVTRQADPQFDDLDFSEKNDALDAICTCGLTKLLKGE
jgi:hypothetical protein